MTKREELLDGVDFSKMAKDDWYIERDFDEIKNFRATGAYTTLNDNMSDGIIGVYIDNIEAAVPNASQIDALYYFFDHQKEVLDSLCQGILKKYPAVMDMYDQEGYDNERGFPQLSTVEEVKGTIGIGNLHIHEDVKDGLSYYGFECGCPWDEEHGLGVLMHGTRVIDIGQASDAFTGTTEMLKDNGTYEQHLERMKEIKKEVELHQAEIEEERKKNWWKFWKK